jgi:serine/threonine protein kinase
VLHLDLSPANVLVGRNGTAKLSDFGMAGKGRGKPAGRIIGTPAALSPEHVAGTECSARSDLFSFGSLLYYAARGEPLFDPGPGNSRVTEAMREIESARARPPEDRLRALPPPLAGAVRMALQGSAGAEVAAELRAAFREECGDADPALILGREAGGGESGDAGPAQKGDALRAEYRRLRAQGRHREAVGLLERALRRHPEDPVLRELLAEPPVPRNSGGATMEVNTGSPASPMPESEDARRRTGPAAWIGAGALALFLGLFAWTRAGSRPGKPGVKERAEFPSAAPGPARPAGSASPSGSSSFSKSGAIAPAKLEALPPPAPKDAPGKRHPTAAAVREAASPAPAGRRRPLPPALTLSGSAGTRITVNDTLAWTAPAPPDGWPVSPGLLTLTLAPAGEGRPITTRLFAAADTLYEFRLDGKGGFSVARRRR